MQRQPGAWARIRERAPQWPEFLLWRENAQALDLWWSLQSQWRISDGMATGLDWSSVRAVPAVVALRGRRRREALLADIAVMEHAWLAERARIVAQRRQQQPG